MSNKTQKENFEESSHRTFLYNKQQTGGGDTFTLLRDLRKELVTGNTRTIRYNEILEKFTKPKEDVFRENTGYQRSKDALYCQMV